MTVLEGTCCGHDKTVHELRLGPVADETGQVVEGYSLFCTECEGCPGWDGMEEAPLHLADEDLYADLAFWSIVFENWPEAYGWRHLFGYLQWRVGGATGTPSINGLYAGVHVKNSVHYRDSLHPGPPWPKGNDGCGVDIGRGTTKAGMEKCLVVLLEPDNLRGIDQIIFEHTIWIDGKTYLYGPHDHCSHGYNLHLHIGIRPNFRFPRLPVKEPEDHLQREGRARVIVGRSIGYARFQNHHAGGKFFLDASMADPKKLDGAHAIGWTKSTSPKTQGGQNQLWVFTPHWKPEFVVIVNRFTERALDVAEGKTNPGTPIVLWEIHWGDNQGWKPVHAAEHTVTFVSALDPELVMELDASHSDPGGWMMLQRRDQAQKAQFFDLA